MVEYLSNSEFSFCMSSSDFLPYTLTKTTMIAITIKIPSGITIPKMTPKLVDDYLADFVSATTASADPLIGTPPTLAPEDKADDIPLATAPTLEELPIERTVSALTDPSKMFLKKHCFLVNFVADGSRLALTCETNHSSNSSMISMNPAIPMSNLALTLTLLSEIQSIPLNSN